MLKMWVVVGGFFQICNYIGMGLTVPDAIVLKSGSALSNCYISFSPGATIFPLLPAPLVFAWTVDADNKKHFFAQGTMYTYLNKASKDAGLEPLQTDMVKIPADASSDGVFEVFFAHARVMFPDATRA